MAPGSRSSARGGRRDGRPRDHAELGERAHERIDHFLTRKVEEDQLEQGARDDALGRLTLTTELDDLADCDLVIEAIVEELELKRELLAGSTGSVDPRRCSRRTRPRSR